MKYFFRNLLSRILNSGPRYDHDSLLLKLDKYSSSIPKKKVCHIWNKLDFTERSKAVQHASPIQRMMLFNSIPIENILLFSFCLTRTDFIELYRALDKQKQSIILEGDVLPKRLRLFLWTSLSDQAQLELWNNFSLTDRINLWEVLSDREKATFWNQLSFSDRKILFSKLDYSAKTHLESLLLKKMNIR